MCVCVCVCVSLLALFCFSSFVSVLLLLLLLWGGGGGSLGKTHCCQENNTPTTARVKDFQQKNCRRGCVLLFNREESQATSTAVNVPRRSSP